MFGEGGLLGAVLMPQPRPYVHDLGAAAGANPAYNVAANVARNVYGSVAPAWSGGIPAAAAVTAQQQPPPQPAPQADLTALPPDQSAASIIYNRLFGGGQSAPSQ